MPLLTKDELWTALCRTASSDAVAAENGLLFNDGHWSVEREMDEGAQELARLFLPLLGPVPADRPMVVGHLAQSLDGFIARSDGESHWITGPEDLDHTHRLRAFCDAVLVGATTVSSDDCRLTVRRCEGTHPLRVVLDPRGSLTEDRSIFQQTEGDTLRVVGRGVSTASGAGVQTLELNTVDGLFDLNDLVNELADRGIRRLFVEGGGVTITCFLQAELLDRLHLAVAPVLLGQGRKGFSASLGDCLSSSPRPDVAVTPIGSDWLYDCDFGTLR
jgi:riboflavin-specific deaminase-like protein